MHPMGEAIQESSGKAFTSQALCPMLKGQVCGDHQAVVFVGAADYLEEEFSPSLGEGNVS
jgi:hypothetical protein